jgi:hypothetical protein
MDLLRQRVFLEGGSFDGTTALANPPPSTLTVTVLEPDDSTWLETYAYSGDWTSADNRDGAMRIMQFERRVAE